jgi:predicted nucleic acid-binding protein
VLVALPWPNHVHHRAARVWFDREAGAGWASCPITQLGFVRVPSNPRAIPDAYLLALAHHHESHRVTLDRGIPHLIRDPAERARRVHLIPA